MKPVPEPAAYPATRRDDVHDEIHGVKVADPYRWLEAEAKPEVQAWMTAQHDVTRAYLDKLPRRAQISARIAELSYFDVRRPGSPARRRERRYPGAGARRGA